MLGDLVQWAPLGLPAFLFVITVVVFFHELGHFLVARACGVAIDTFSIGFGPSLVGWTDSKGTRWKVSAIPLGGYVKFIGDEDSASRPDREAIAQLSAGERASQFHEKPLWQRAAVVAAGPAANFVLAILIFAATYMAVGRQIMRPVIGNVAPASAGAAAGLKAGDRILKIDGEDVTSYADFESVAAMSPGRSLTIVVMRDGHRLALQATPRFEKVTDRFGNVQRLGSLGTRVEIAPIAGAVTPHSAAAAAGFQPGDRITAIDGRPISSFGAMQRIVQNSAGQSLTFAVLRGGKTVTLTAVPRRVTVQEPSGGSRSEGRLGIAGGIDPDEIETLHYGPVGALREAVGQTWFVVDSTVTYLWRMVRGHEDATQLSGPVGIARVSQQVATIGFLALINLAALLSVSIGLVNLFPVPILDGGHLLYYGFEAVLGHPLGARAQDVGFRVGLAVMLGLMVLATWNDLVRLNLF